LAALQAQAPRPNLKVGDMAPELTLPSTAGGDVKLSDFRGKKGVVLAFVIRAFTGACTKEVQGYQAVIQKFEESGYPVFAIGTDDLDTLKRWAAELKLTFPLLSDADGKVAQAYGVLMDTHKLAFRTTFVIDRDGKIEYVEKGGSAIDPNGAVTACSRHSAPAAH
jgi:peroxiredoxin